MLGFGEYSTVFFIIYLDPAAPHRDLSPAVLQTDRKLKSHLHNKILNLHHGDAFRDSTLSSSFFLVSNGKKSTKLHKQTRHVTVQ